MFTEKQADFIRNPDSVDADNRWNYQKVVSNRVNGDLPQVLGLFPELTEYLDEETKGELRMQSEPEYLAKSLGDLYANQLENLIFGLILSEQQPDEPADEFVDRFDVVWEEIGQAVRQRIQHTQLSYEIRHSFGTLQQNLFDHIGNHIDAMTELSGVKIRVPRDVFIRWAVTHELDGEVEYLPDILDAAFAITTDAPHTERATTYWKLISSVASEQGLTPSDRMFDFTNPSDRGYELHEMVLSALDDEVQTACHHYWRENQIRELDRLLALGLLACNDLIDRDEEILEMVPSSNTREGWTGYDTRRANYLTNDRNPLILSRETIPKSGTDEQRYTFTEFGEFVYWLNKFAEREDSLETVIYNFIREIYDGQSINEIPTDEVLGDDTITGSVLWVELMKKTDLLSE